MDLKFFYSFFIIFLLGQSLYSVAQTPAEKNRISQTYNQNYLSQLQNRLSKKSIQQKQYALAQAKIYGWEVTIDHPDGRFSELMKVVNGKPIYYTTFNADAAISTRANFLHNGGGLGLNLEGQGMTAFVWDGGHARVTHQEYDGIGGANRVSIGDSPLDLNFHSAHVTGTIVASGFEADAKGMAPQASAVSYQWDSDLSEATAEAAAGMLVSNHSYGYVATGIPDEWFGQYGSDAYNWDDIMYTAPYYLMIVAAGNDGNDNSSNALPLDANSSYDKLSGHATAKNNLVVANAEDAAIDAASGNLLSVSINSSSSEGPTDDYRIKPDITGNGTGLYSTYETADDIYASITGTSMASPNVTGSLLLLQQHYNNLNVSFMRAATLKGLALHTADDAGAIGPDAIFGWGLLNTKVAANVISNNSNESLIEELHLNAGASFTIDVESDGSNPLMASISWTDPAGTANTGTANDTTPVLVNDLDIRITQASNTYYPYKLTSVTTNTTGDNLVDPYERIAISGASGTYTITVTHKGNLSGGNSQHFSLIVTGITYVENCSVSIPTSVEASIIEAYSATIIWDYIQDAAYELRYRELGTSTWTTTSVNTSSYIITGLAEQTQYEVQVRSICPDSSMSAYSSAVNFMTLACSYCTSSFSDTSDDRISNLTFNTIDNDSNSLGYEDFTSLSTDIVLGNTYSLSLDVTVNGPWEQHTLVWIDWNQDCDFDDTQETYDLGNTDGSSGTHTLSTSITVPTDAILGTTRMRLIEMYGSNPASCANDTYGETEYYSLNILGAGSIVITEIMKDPSVVNDDVGEWFEVYNTTDTAIDMQGWTISDDDIDSHSINASLVVPAGGYAVLGRNTDINTNGGVIVDYSYANFFMLANDSGGDEIVLETSGVEIDRVNYDDGTTFPDPIGASMTLDPTVLDDISNNYGDNWCIATSTYGDGDLGTPNATNDICFNCKPLNQTTWNGTTWDNGTPDATKPVVIDGDYNGTTNFTCCELTINNGATLTINAGEYIQIEHDFVNNGVLSILHEGSLVQTDDTSSVSGTGTYQVHKTTTSYAEYDYTYWSSPTSDETIEDVFNTNSTLSAGNSTNSDDFSPANHIYKLDTAAFSDIDDDTFDDDANDWVVATGTMTVAKGYIAMGAGSDFPFDAAARATGLEQSVFFEGAVNNGPIDIPVVLDLYNQSSGTGHDSYNTNANLIGNPYPSAIDIHLLMSLNPVILQGDFYFWTHDSAISSANPGPDAFNFTNDDYSILTVDVASGITSSTNGSNNTTANRYIASGQGFLANVTSAGNVTFTNAMRVTGNNNTLLRTETTIDRFWLNLTKEESGIFRQILVGFYEGATDSYLAGQDGQRLENGTNTDFYSIITDDPRHFAIQNLATFNDTKIINLGLEVVESGIYEIDIDHLEGIFNESQAIYLQDNYLGIVHNFTNGAYSFSSDIGEAIEDRFVLSFTNESLSIDEMSIDGLSIFPNPSNDTFNVVWHNELNALIKVYDVSGRLIVNEKCHDNQYQIDLSNYSTGIYFAIINIDTRQVVRKLVLK